MKNRIIFIFLMLLSFNTIVFAQNPGTDYVVIGLVSGDANMKQVQMHYNGNSGVYFAAESSGSGIEQITEAIAGRQINDLQIFVRNDPQKIFLTNTPVTSANVNGFANYLSGWKKSISGKVAIHNQTGVTSPELDDLLGKLKELTGLQFILIQ